MILEDQLKLKMLEVTNERDYRLMLENEKEALYPPWFFTWVEDGKFAAFAWPQTPGNFEYLWQDGIRYMVTLTPDVPDLSRTNCGWSHIPIEEGAAPTIEEIFKFIRTVQLCRKRNLPLGVHCRLGLGRTGVMVAVYLMYFHGLEAERALRNLRYLRPGSVDTAVQEECILNYRLSAKIANEKRLKRITRKADHLLSILRNEGEGLEGVRGLPRCWAIGNTT